MRVSCSRFVLMTFPLRNPTLQAFFVKTPQIYPRAREAIISDYVPGCFWGFNQNTFARRGGAVR